MAVLAKSVAVDHNDTAVILKFPAAVADAYYAGAILCVHANGGVTPVPAATLPVAGVCVTENPTAAAGDLIEVLVKGRVRIVGPTFAATDVGKRVFVDVSAASDNPADLLPLAAGAIAAGDLPLGTVDRFETTTSAWVDLERKALEPVHA